MHDLAHIVKKSSKNLLQKFGSNEKVLTFVAALEKTRRMFWEMLTDAHPFLRKKPGENIFYGGSEKKFEKKVRKDLEGM